VANNETKALVGMGRKGDDVLDRDGKRELSYLI